MHVSTVRLQLSRRITVKNAKGDYDSTEVQVAVEGSLTPQDDGEQELGKLSLLARKHIDKEFEMAASEKSQVVVDLIRSKEATSAAAAPPPVVEPQVFTRKPVQSAAPSAVDYKCIEGCGRPTREANRRCSPCYTKWNNAGRPRRN